MKNASILTVAQVAKALRKDNQTIRYLLDNKIVTWGMSYKRQGSKRKSYLIYKEKFQAETGIRIEDGGTLR